MQLTMQLPAPPSEILVDQGWWGPGTFALKSPRSHSAT